MNLTLNKSIRGLFTRQSGLLWYAVKLSLVAKGSPVLKTHNMTPHCDLDLEDSKAFFTRHWLIMMHFHTMFRYKRLYCSEDIIRVNNQWHFEPLLWPWLWPWTQQSTHSIRHWVTAVHDDVAKVSVVQKVPSGQTLKCILNHYCGLDLLHNNKKTLSKYDLAYGGLPTNKIW